MLTHNYTYTHTHTLTHTHTQTRLITSVHGFSMDGWSVSESGLAGLVPMFGGSILVVNIHGELFLDPDVYLI